MTEQERVMELMAQALRIAAQPHIHPIDEIVTHSNKALAEYRKLKNDILD